jgi:uncharacterized membrane protein
MATIQQQIEVAADATLVRQTWSRFIQWVHTGPGRLACDELACVDAVRAGLVTFVPAPGGRTTVVFRLEEQAEGPSPTAVRRQLGHDLVVFKDYVEHRRSSGRSPSETDEAALEAEATRRGDRPRRMQPSSEGDTTFFSSHFPT